jgi:hypothetical protein
MAKKKSSGYRPQKSSEKREKRTDENNHEFRFDIRARWKDHSPKLLGTSRRELPTCRR